MSQRNVEIVRRVYEGVNLVGVADLIALPDETLKGLYQQLFHPELVIRQSPELFIDTAGTFHGYAGFLDCTRELLDAFGDVEFQAGKSYVSGNQIVFDVTAVTSGRASGIPLQLRLAHLWEVEEGLIVGWSVFPTLREALEAAGLSE